MEAPKYLVGDKIQTLREAPFYDENGVEIGTEKLTGTIERMRRLPDGGILYYCLTKHGMVPEREDQIEPAIP